MASSSSLAVKESWVCESVIRTPSTIGKVGGVAVARQPEILCDWFQGTMSSSSKDVVIAKLTDEFGDATVCNRVPHGMSCYRSVMTFADGTRLFLDNRYSDTCCIVLSGTAEPTRHLSLIRELVRLGVRATRIDLAFDDRRCVLAPSAIYLATKSGSMVSRWKESRWSESIQNSSGAKMGQGMVVGSKTSAAYLSVYDKGLETESASEGEWIRWELRLADKQAEEFVEAFFADNSDSTEDDLRKHVAKAKAKQRVLCYDAKEIAIFESELSPELVDRFKRLALEDLKARLSFRERTTSINISRAMVLPWWECLLEYFDPASRSKTDCSTLEYEELVRLNNQKKWRENSVRQQAEEVLTAVYEQHIKAHKPSLAEAISRIPEYEDDDDGNDQFEDELLALVGLQSSGNNVISIQKRPRRQEAPVVRGLVPRSAQVILFHPKQSVPIAVGPTRQGVRGKGGSEMRSGAPPE